MSVHEERTGHWHQFAVSLPPAGAPAELYAGRRTPDGRTVYRLGTDRLPSRILRRIAEAVAIAEIQIDAIRRGHASDEQLERITKAQFEWFEGEQTAVALERWDSMRRLLERSLGPCVRCGRPTTHNAALQLRHLGPDGLPSCRTCRAASKEWLRREDGPDAPVRWDDDLPPTVVVRLASSGRHRSYGAAARL